MIIRIVWDDLQFAVKNRQSNLEDVMKFCPICGEGMYHFKHIKDCAASKNLARKATAFAKGCFSAGMRGPLPTTVRDELYAAALESKELFFKRLDHVFRQTGVGLSSDTRSQPLYDMDEVFSLTQVC